MERLAVLGKSYLREEGISPVVDVDSECESPHRNSKDRKSDACGTDVEKSFANLIALAA